MRDPRIWKYSIPLDGNATFTIAIPGGDAAFLSAALQGDPGQPVMWWVVDSRSTTESEHRFAIVETGQRLPDVLRGVWVYRSTFMFRRGAYVLHLFEEV